MFDVSEFSAGAVVPAVTPSDLDAIVKLMLDFEKGTALNTANVVLE